MVEISRRLLGRTGLEVTALGYGAMELRGRPTGPDLSDRQAQALLNRVLDEGINFIDTSVDYGRSEELIGRYISHRRSEYVLASKCGCVPGAPIGTEHVHTDDNVRAGVEHSLRLMKTDHLDLVQFHRSLSRAEFESESGLAALLRLKEQGKVRFIGVSAVLPTLDEQIQMGVFDAFQIPYSALQRDHEDAIARAAAAGAGIIIRGGVARGAPADWEKRAYYMVSSKTLRARWEQARLDDLLGGMDRIEFMLRFTLSLPDLSTTIVGTANLEHLQSNLEVAAKGGLPGPSSTRPNEGSPRPSRARGAILEIEILGIDHLYITVRDLGRSQDFYDRVMSVLRRPGWHPAGGGQPARCQASGRCGILVADSTDRRATGADHAERRRFVIA